MCVVYDVSEETTIEKVGTRGAPGPLLALLLVPGVVGSWPGHLVLHPYSQPHVCGDFQGTPYL